VADLDDSTIEHVMDVNFYGALYMTRAFLPLLLMRSEASIVNVSSMGGFLPVPGQSIYGAAKAAVKIMTEGLRSELKHTNVKVSVVFPGAINTTIKAHSGAVEGGEDGREDGSPRDDRSNRANKTLSPVQAVQIIIKGIKKNSPRIFVGRDSRFLDLIYRLNPGFASNLIAGFMKSHIPE
jgi:short-subunit dehydrogenase